ncbi:MAG: hypothetical protein Q7U92_12280, partial [Bradyrhizobium sp.]|nr:hypothetical protein [Bradyrhizobium sp.]
MMLPARRMAAGQIIAIAPGFGGGHRHARDFSLKVVAKPVMKTGAGAGSPLTMRRAPNQGQGENPH